MTGTPADHSGLESTERRRPSINWTEGPGSGPGVKASAAESRVLSFPSPQLPQQEDGEVCEDASC